MIGTDPDDVAGRGIVVFQRTMIESEPLEEAADHLSTFGEQLVDRASHASKA